MEEQKKQLNGSINVILPKFLETRVTLSQTPEFLSYYALHVPNPSEHPFLNIYEGEWLAEIRHRLERFLDVI